MYASVYTGSNSAFLNHSYFATEYYTHFITYSKYPDVFGRKCSGAYVACLSIRHDQMLHMEPCQLLKCVVKFF